jgi:hypothetical protein
MSGESNKNSQVEAVYWDPVSDQIALPTPKRLRFDRQWQAESYIKVVEPLAPLKWKILAGKREVVEKDPRLVPLSALVMN